MNRRLNFQTLSWFYDLYVRTILDMDPPYQRRSVWNQSFKDYFVDTVLLNYPAPAVFLYEDISPEGRSTYHVVDGKQRLTTLFEFVANEFPVAENSELSQLRGKYFAGLDDATKRAVWSYQFLLEYVPADDPKVINAIFDRINRNVAKLSSQELRHAKLDGLFISVAEELAEWMSSLLPINFPRFVEQSRKQMKDVEFASLLLLLIEQGPRGFSQDDLDAAFTSRDQEWESRHATVELVKGAVTTISRILQSVPDIRVLTGSRLRNQADFYSLVGAIAGLQREERLPTADEMAQRLVSFLQEVEDVGARAEKAHLNAYYDAARSASNDAGPRERRIAVMKDVLCGRL